MWFLQSGVTLKGALSMIFILLVTIFIVMPIHEWAHGFVAYKLGDSTAKYNGRLTLNPLQHIDPLGAASMILFRVGWAKPVPVDARNFKNPKLGMALTALAGPMSNLIIAFLSAIGLFSLIYFGESVQSEAATDIISVFATFLYILMDVNVGLAVFNLIPLPPLDGSKILGVFLPDKFLYKYYQYERYITFAVFFLLFTNVLSIPLTFIKKLILSGIGMLLSGLHGIIFGG